MKGKRIAGIICAAVGCAGLIGLAKSYSTALLIGSAGLLIVGAVLIILSIVQKKKAPEVKQPAQKKPEKPKAETARPRLGNIYQDDFVLRYRYDDRLSDPDILSARGHAGARVSFDGASVMLDGHEIGLLPNDKHIQMVEDYTRRGDLILAFIRKVSDEGIFIDLGFFKNKKDLNAETCKLSGGKKYQDARDCCSVGDEVTIVEDYELEDRYCAETDYDVIGLLPSGIELNASHIIAGEIIQNDDDGCVIRFYP